jgi:hypothetical protein
MARIIQNWADDYRKRRWDFLLVAEFPGRTQMKPL